MRKAGQISSLLLGCVDNHSSGDYFLTLCDINANSVKFTVMSTVMRKTGFNVDSYKHEGNCGKWFKSDRKTVPDFISQLSFQRSMDGDQE